MTKTITFMGILMFVALLPGSALAVDDLSKMTPQQILDKVDDLYRGESAKGSMTMKVVTEHWTREMKMEFWSKGKEKSLTRILSPRKEKGTATLKNGDNIWNYLPKVKRTIKVPSSMMGGSWMGSHFTNDDLVKESRMAEDYTFRISFDGQRKLSGAESGGEGGEVAVIEIECLPKENAAVVWGKVLVLVRRADYQPLKMTYFDEDLELGRTMVFSDFRQMDDRLVPCTMRVLPADKPDEFTEVRYQKMRFNIKVKDSKFSLRSLQK